MINWATQCIAQNIEQFIWTTKCFTAVSVAWLTQIYFVLPYLSSNSNYHIKPSYGNMSALSKHQYFYTYLWPLTNGQVLVFFELIPRKNILSRRKRSSLSINGLKQEKPTIKRTGTVCFAAKTAQIVFKNSGFSLFKACIEMIFIEMICIGSSWDCNDDKQTAWAYHASIVYTESLYEDTNLRSTLDNLVVARHGLSLFLWSPKWGCSTFKTVSETNSAFCAKLFSVFNCSEDLA